MVSRLVTPASLLLSFSLLLNACGQMPGSSQAIVDPAFVSYVQSFEADALHAHVALSTESISAQFGEVKAANQNGICNLGTDGSAFITINRTAWNQMSELGREQLIYHEMGHCLLKRGHRSDYRLDGSPYSLMSKYSIDDRTYSQYRDSYKQELFSQ